MTETIFLKTRTVTNISTTQSISNDSNNLLQTMTVTIFLFPQSIFSGILRNFAYEYFTSFIEKITEDS